MSEMVYLGVDGGATKTEVACLNREGRFLCSVKGPPTTLNARATKKAVKDLELLIRKACSKVRIDKSNLAFSGFGICGVDYPSELRQQRKTLFSLLGMDPHKAVLVNDGVAALWGGARTETSIVLQVGTGFTAAYRDAYGREKPFDQVNCGVVVNLRRMVYVYAARSIDGRERKSVLPELLMQYFEEKDTEKLILKLRRHRYSREKVSNVLPVLNKAVVRKDPLSRKIVKIAAEQYALDICTMVRKLKNPQRVEVVLGGGVLENGPPVLRSMVGRLVRKKYPGAFVHKPVLSPGIGAAVMAAFHDGQNPKKVFQQACKTVHCRSSE